MIIMNRLTYWILIISISAIGGLIANVFRFNESFSKDIMVYIILFIIPTLAVIRMNKLGMKPKEMLRSVYNRQLTFRRLFGKNFKSP
jgi:hypothetical protein